MEHMFFSRRIHISWFWDAKEDIQKLCWHKYKDYYIVINTHLPWNMKKVLRRYPFEILCGNWSLPYTGWEKPKKQIFPSANTEISQFQNMASIKTNKIKKRTPLHNINFWKLTTLLFCPKRFRHSKGPKNAICLWLSHNKEHCRLNMQCPLS